MRDALRFAVTPLAAAVLAGPVGAQVQGFSSGSNGSFGPIDVAASTTLSLPIPGDGIFHATSVNVAANATLSFQRNARNTPVHMLATGAVQIDGTISLDAVDQTGVAGPGGFDGGGAGASGIPPGAGQGPGGGLGGNSNDNPGGAGQGGYATRGSSPRSEDGQIYGSPLLVPLLGGSGGGGATSSLVGGGGGGAILIASDVSISLSGAGAILARGGRGGGGADNSGSGGAIRLLAPLVTTAGTLDVRDQPLAPGNDTGGVGRVRVDAFTHGPGGTVMPFGLAVSRGSLMLVFPQPLPRLDVVEAAGTAIAIDSGPVQVVLPTGSPSAQQVVVRGSGFSAPVAIEVQITPENGTPAVYPAVLDPATGPPAEVTVNVDIPANTPSFVHVWRR